MEVRYRDTEPAGGGVSDAEVESVMKMLMAYQKARAEGVGQPNPELDHLLGAMQNSLPNGCPINEGLKIPSVATQPGAAPSSDEVIPKPFFVLKTKNEIQQRVYMNICGSHKIRAPDYGEDNVVNVDDIRKKLQNFNPADDPDCPDVRFPCSCLDPISLTNKKGLTYVIYDVCYNRTVVESAMSSKPLKLFIIDLAFTWLGQKYKTQLSSDFKILEGRKYKGKEVGKHTIRVDPKKGPIIAELPDDDDDDAEPIIPLLLGDKHGRSCSSSEVQGIAKIVETVNRDRYQELPEWVPEFYPSNVASNVAKDKVAPQNQQGTSTELNNCTPSQELGSCDPSCSSKSRKEKSNEPLPLDDSPAQPWMPSGMFRELNTPSPSPDLDTSDVQNIESRVPDLEASKQNTKSRVPDLEASKESTARKATKAKFKFKELSEVAEKSETSENKKQENTIHEFPREIMTTPKIETEYIKRPVVATVVIVTFPLPFVGLEDMHVHMTSTTIFINTTAYGALQVELQFYVSPTGVQAEYRKHDKVLRFELRMLTYAQALKLKL